MGTNLERADDLVAVAEHAASSLTIAQKLRDAREARAKAQVELEDARVRRGLEILEFLGIVYDALDTPEGEVTVAAGGRGERMARWMGLKKKEIIKGKAVGYGVEKDAQLLIDRNGKIWINLKWIQMDREYFELHQRVGGVFDWNEEWRRSAGWEATRDFRDVVPFSLEEHKDLIDWKRLCRGGEWLMESLHLALEEKLQKEQEKADRDTQEAHRLLGR